MEVTFGSLSNGDRFKFNNLIWVKSKQKTKSRFCKSCGKTNYNAHVAGNKSQTRKFSPQDKVEIFED